MTGVREGYSWWCMYNLLEILRNKFPSVNPLAQHFSIPLPPFSSKHPPSLSHRPNLPFIHPLNPAPSALNTFTSATTSGTPTGPNSGK